MKVKNTYIVQSTRSYSEDELCILFQTECDNFFLKFEGFHREEFIPIEEEEAKKMILKNRIK